MNSPSLAPRARYHLVSITLHWGMLGIMVLTYASINLRELFERGSTEVNLLKQIHFVTGLLILFLLVARIAARFAYPVPAVTPEPSVAQHRAASAMHITLYVWMAAMPLLGWLILSAGGKPIPFFGLDLPALMAPDKAIQSLLKEVHEIGGNVGYFLIAAHAAASLVHHYIVGDNTLTRMR